MRIKRFTVVAAMAASILLPGLSAQAQEWKTRSYDNDDVNGSENQDRLKLKGSVQQTGAPVSGSWMSASDSEIDSAFQTYSSTGGPDLVDELPKNLYPVLSDYRGGWSHPPGRPGIDFLCPDWNAWVGNLHRAMYQLRWQLWTDPQQKPCKLGQYEGGSSCFLQPGDSSWDGMVIHNCRYPALSKHAYFSGRARVLVEFHPDRRLQAKILSSTLPPEVTDRLKASLDALNGHPLLTYPARGQKFDTVPIIYRFAFDSPDSVN